MLNIKYEIGMVYVKIKCLIDEIDMDIDFTKNCLEMREQYLREAEKEYKQEKVTVIKADLEKIEGDIYE